MCIHCVCKPMRTIACSFFQLLEAQEAKKLVERSLESSKTKVRITFTVSALIPRILNFDIHNVDH